MLNKSKHPKRGASATETRCKDKKIIGTYAIFYEYFYRGNNLLDMVADDGMMVGHPRYLFR